MLPCARFSARTMYIFVIVLWFLLINNCHSQLKACYEASDEKLIGNFPCDPDAEVSACCAPGNICSSNLFCVSASNHQNYVGTCTDPSWASSACPFNLTSGHFDPWYDKFNYALNTTQCPNGTLCPFANNQNCCNQDQGIEEVDYNYNSSAAMPTDVGELTAFYAAAGYTFLASIPTASSNPTTPAVSASATSSPATTGMGKIAHPKSPTTPTTPTISSSSPSSSSSSPPSTTPSSNPSRNTQTATANNQRLTTTANNPTATPPPSLAAKISIGICAALGVALCALGAVLLRARRRRRRRKQQDASGSPAAVRREFSELEGTHAGAELKESRQVHELYDGSAWSLRG